MLEVRALVDGAADVGIAAGRAADDAVGQAGVVDVIADNVPLCGMKVSLPAVSV